MKKLETLQERYADLEGEFNALYETAENESRDYSTAERAKMVTLNKQMKDLETEMDEVRAIEERRAANLEAKERASTDQRRPTKKFTPEEKARKRYSIVKAIRSQLPNSNSPLSGIELEMHQEGAREARTSGVSGISGVAMPSFFLDFRTRENADQKRDLVVGVAADGGNLVDTELGGLIPALRPRLVVEQMGATVLSGLTGPIDFPRNTTTTAATWEGETDTNADSQPALNKVEMRPHRLGANTPFSKQLLLQASLDVEQMVIRQLERAIEQALEFAALAGDSGSIVSQPDGLLTIAGVNSVALGTDGAALTWDDIVAMESAVATDDADYGRLGYVTTPGVRGALKTTVKDAGSGQFIWKDGSAPTAAQRARIDELNSYRAMVTTRMPSNLTKGAGTNLHALLFGNFEELVIGQWGGVDMVIDPYSKKKEASIEITANTWWDIATRHPESFCKIVDAVV